MKFTADQFLDTEWESAQDKAKFANHYVRFVESGFKQTLFQKWFYRSLILKFGHIAHYDIHGFYSQFFTSPRGKVEFIQQMLDFFWADTDVERALRAHAKQVGWLEKFKAELDRAVEISILPARAN